LTTIDVGTLADEGALRTWLDARGASTVLVRPDFYVFGTSSDDVEALVERLAKALRSMAPEECAA